MKIGVIRYDAWSAGDEVPHRPEVHPSNVIFLIAHQWFDRVPFYATLSDSGRWGAASDRQEVADQEIDYAASRGIDYFAFLYGRFATRDYQTGQYRPVDQLGNIIHLHRGSHSFDHYLASTRCNKPRYTLILQWDLLNSYINEWTAGNFSPRHVWSIVVADIVQQMDRDRDRVHTTPDGRPILFWFDGGRWTSIWKGDPVEARARLDELRQAFLAAGMKNPYFAVMAVADDADQVIADAGFDAVSSYGWASASPAASGGVKELPFTDALKDLTWFWNRVVVDFDREIIPRVTVGWDSRPLNALGREPWTWYERATPAELIAQLDAAVTYIADHPANAPAKSVLIYAWNELAEGGFLVPTLQHGTAYLDARADGSSASDRAMTRGDHDALQLSASITANTQTQLLHRGSPTESCGQRRLSDRFCSRIARMMAPTISPRHERVGPLDAVAAVDHPAERAQAREAHVEAHFGDRRTAREDALGAVEAHRGDVVLRRAAEREREAAQE